MFVMMLTGRRTLIWMLQITGEHRHCASGTGSRFPWTEMGYSSWNCWLRVPCWSANLLRNVHKHHQAPCSAWWHGEHWGILSANNWSAQDLTAVNCSTGSLPTQPAWWKNATSWAFGRAVAASTAAPWCAQHVETQQQLDLQVKTRTRRACHGNWFSHFPRNRVGPGRPRTQNGCWMMLNDFWMISEWCWMYVFVWKSPPELSNFPVSKVWQSQWARQSRRRPRRQESSSPCPEVFRLSKAFGWQSDYYSVIFINTIHPMVIIRNNHISYHGSFQALWMIQ